MTGQLCFLPSVPLMIGNRTGDGSAFPIGDRYSCRSEAGACSVQRRAFSSAETTGRCGGAPVTQIARPHLYVHMYVCVCIHRSVSQLIDVVDT